MINRYFAGEDSVPSGVGISMFDHDHDLPPEGEAWSTSIDYQPVFKKVWGVS
jgi:ribose transport system substrate-binding protein